MSDEKNYSLQEVTSFLLGEGELEGHSFGEVPEWGTQYWWRRYLRKALSQPATVEGWKLVPVEPTQEMCAQAMEDEGSTIKDGKKYAAALYRAMLAAVPTLPQSEDARGAEPVAWVVEHRPSLALNEYFPWMVWKAKCPAFDKQYRCKTEEEAKWLADLLNQAPASGLLSEKVEPVAYAYKDFKQLMRRYGHSTIQATPASEDDTALYTLPPTAQQALQMAADVAHEVLENRGLFGTITQEKVVEAILALTPPTDTVMMTRDGVEEFGKNCAREALFQASNGVINDADYNLSAIVAQHMPKESK